MSAIIPPQKWCGQTQPHKPHVWADKHGWHASCGGHS
jgi:hypothetical protein